MKKIIELLNDELKAAFSACGYDEKYAKVVVSNRPDLCQYQCNGCMAEPHAKGAVWRQPRNIRRHLQLLRVR